MTIATENAGQSSSIISEVKNTVLVILGIFSAGMGIKGFLLSSHFIDGGVTGISMLLNGITGINGQR